MGSEIRTLLGSSRRERVIAVAKALELTPQEVLRRAVDNYLAALPVVTRHRPLQATLPGCSTGLKANGRSERAEPIPDADFDAWYPQHPRREKRLDALRAWSETENVRPPLSDMLRAAAAYAASVVDCEPSKIALPASWLRARRWQDEYAPLGPRRLSLKEYDAQKATEDEGLFREWQARKAASEGGS